MVSTASRTGSGRRANKNSVLPVLEFLATSGTARFIHERVSTLDELKHRVDDWAPRKQYAVGYLALHGSPQSVWVGRHELTLNHLLLLDHEDGSTPVDLHGKTLFLASCSTVATRPSALREIVDQTSLTTLCGYASEVEWFEAAAFDLLVLSALANYSRAERRHQVPAPSARAVSAAGALQVAATVEAGPSSHLTDDDLRLRSKPSVA